MPSTYFCNECRLIFSVEWFHFHRGDYKSGYYMVCKKCGIQYLLMCSAANRDAKLLKSPNRLKVDKDQDCNDSVSMFYTVFQNWPIFQTFSTQTIDKDHKRQRVQEEELVKNIQGNVACGNCGNVNAITSIWDSSNHLCPDCTHSRLILQSSWDT
jgi:hypothetical protein